MHPTKPHPWNITKEALAENTKQLGSIELRELLWAFSYCESKQIGLVKFGEAAGISGDTLRKIVTGTYVDPYHPERRLDMPDPMPMAIAAFRETVGRTQPQTVRFVSTETSRNIGKFCDLARESNSPVFLSGASHIGKTTALGKYRDANPRDTWLITVTSGMSAKSLAEAICDETGVSAAGSLSTLTRRLGRAIPPEGLLIIDDFHVLTLASTPRTFLAAMEFLRAVYDSQHCGMLFSTTELDYTKLAKLYAQSLHQLMRRGVHAPTLGGQPRQADVRAIIEAHGLPWPAKALAVDGEKPWQVLASLAAKHGLKIITERLRYALKIAARETVPVTWSHFIRAHTVIANSAKAPANDWT
jgi:DNA transposition AAA+ family ATPase